ncbi:MAG: helix-turn-helix domain-containing protein [Roseburia sp.]|nr:helix-turn-helix domain-containing protein [Roseburia sp.]
MSEYLLISDAAKEVCVESHVLRYWEEELHLPIKRNELGHRYYTAEDVERFKQIKSMKERGLQLKAIKMILKDGKLDILEEEKKPHMAIDIVEKKLPEEKAELTREPEPVTPEARVPQSVTGSREEKARRLQWLLQQMMKETLQENNQELCREIKESVIKELDYQFRAQEEREEERDKQLAERNEQYYQKMDALLRVKSRKKTRNHTESKEEGNSEKKPGTEQAKTLQRTKENNKKRHFFF